MGLRTIETLNKKAGALYQAGRLTEALATFDRVAKLAPNRSFAYANRCVVLKDLKRWDEALASADKAVSLQPDDANSWNIRSAVLWDMKRLDEALACIDKVVALNPGSPQAWSNRGAVLHEMRRLDEALASIDKAISLHRDLPDAWANRGVVLRDMKRLVEALASLDKAISLRPNSAANWNNLGIALLHRKRLDEALTSFDRAIAIKPDFAAAWFNRGNVLSQLKRPDQALASYEKTLASDPECEFLLGHFLLAKMTLCDWGGIDETIAKCVAAVRAKKKAVFPFPLLCAVDDPGLQKSAAGIFSDATCPGSKALGPLPSRAADGKIRIGYYSSDFHRHATTFLIAELLEAHDASKYEVYGFSFGPDLKDDMRQRVVDACDTFVDVRDKSDRDVARLSREYGIDIAVDLKGYTHDARPGIFAERCAPIQVSYLGFPGTMGADYMDYLVADRVVLPPQSQGDYSEKIIRLPHSYQANDSQRKISPKAFTREDMGLPASGFVFCCFNNSYKILPETFDSWMRILKAVDGSVLWLLADAANLRKEAAARGVDPARLIMAGRLPMEEHLARHRLADLFLDSWPCNAHTTASDALWAGLPVLTYAGKAFASRVAASLLDAVGLPGLITGSAEDYEAKAIFLASNPQALAQLRKTLESNRSTSPLFDGRLTARHLEAGYEAAYARYRSGLPPENIEIPS